MILLADSEGTGQNARMYRLIWTLAVRIILNARFRMVQPVS